jgi:stalled ribosome rescue protein Dom34
MSYRDAAVWIDHQKAHIFRVEAEVFAESIIRAPEHIARHPRREAQAHNHPDDEQHFFSAIAHSLSGSKDVLIVGPSIAKLHFRDYLLAHASTLKLSVVGVETVDHPTDNQLAAYVRQYFLVRRTASSSSAA